MNDEQPDSPPPRQLSRNTSIMAVGTTLSRLTGFLRLYATIAALGITATSDAYTLANNTPNIIYELVVGGVLSATLVPLFVTLANLGKDEEQEGVDAIFGLVAVVLTVVTLVFVLGAPWLIDLYTLGNHKPYVHTERQVSIYLLRLFAPQVLFYGYISIMTAWLNAKRRFAGPMFAPVVNNLIVIAMFIAFVHTVHHRSLNDLQHDHSALLYLGLFTTLGVLGMALALIPSVRAANLHVHMRWNPRHSAVKKLIRLSGWTFGFVVANQIALLLVLALATRQAGGVTAYNSAYIFFLLPHGIIAVSIMSALQPELSDKWDRGNREEFRAHVSLGLRLIFLILIPAAVGLIVLAGPLVHITLQYGSASHHGTQLVATVLAWMAIGLPAFSIYLFLTRCFQAMHDARTAFWLYVLENGINIVGALIVYKPFGVAGLGFVFGLSYVGGTLAGLWVLRKRIDGLDGVRVMRSLGLITMASILMGVVLLLVRAVGTALAIPAFIYVVIAGILGALAYFSLGRAMGIKEWNLLLRGPLKRFAK